MTVGLSRALLFSDTSPREVVGVLSGSEFRFVSHLHADVQPFLVIRNPDKLAKSSKLTNIQALPSLGLLEELFCQSAAFCV